MVFSKGEVEIGSKIINKKFVGVDRNPYTSDHKFTFIGELMKISTSEV